MFEDRETPDRRSDCATGPDNFAHRRIDCDEKVAERNPWVVNETMGRELLGLDVTRLDVALSV